MAKTSVHSVRNRTRRGTANVAGVESLEARRLLHSAVISPIANYNVPISKSVFVPLSSTYDHADRLVWTSKDNSANVTTQVQPAGNSFVQMTVAGYAEPMVFQLFDDLAPQTVTRFKGLVNAGFYDGLTFHRVINDFVIQGGDPAGNGSGGTGYQFEDEFNPAALFTGNGQLAMANSGKDTNGSQFFITEKPQRGLDFNHTIFGQLVQGESTRQSISNLSTNSNGVPASTVRITRARVVANNTDAVLRVSVTGGVTARVTVTATGLEGATSRSFNVTGVADTINDPPILGATSRTYYTPVNKSISVSLNATDVEGNPIDWAGSYIDGSGASNGSVENGVLTVTPKPNFKGKITLYVGVGVNGASSRGSTSFNENLPLGGIYDTQVVTIAVGELPPARARGLTIDATADAPLKGITVATFRDTDPAGTSANWSANIQWGDGTQTTGTISRNRRGIFSVYANKTYGAAVDGSLPVYVNVTGDKGAAITVNSIATVRSYAALVNGVLFVNGTSGSDRIGIGRKNASYNVTVNGVTRVFAASSVTTMQVTAFDGNDTITLGQADTIGAFINGGAGNDTINGGAGADTVAAGAGDDFVSTFDGNDRVSGEDGNDLIYGGNGRDRLFGQLGDDQIYGQGSADTLSGDEGNDILVGGSGDDRMFGGVGNDILNGLIGNDLNDGGAGRDKAQRDDDDFVRISIEVLVT